jgi:hypothetical protein
MPAMGTTTVAISAMKIATSVPTAGNPSVQQENSNVTMAGAFQSSGSVTPITTVEMVVMKRLRYATTELAQLINFSAPTGAVCLFIGFVMATMIAMIIRMKTTRVVRL